MSSAASLEETQSKSDQPTVEPHTSTEVGYGPLDHENLLIAIPSIGHVETEAFTAILRACMYGQEYWASRSPGGVVRVTVTNRLKTTMARNFIAYQALDSGFDWIMWFDDDAVPEKHIIQRLAKTGKYFVSGLFFARKPVYKSVYHRAARDAETGEIQLKTVLPIPEVPFQVDAMGFHAVLMRTAVIKRVYEYLVEQGVPNDMRHERPLLFCDDFEKIIGQDLDFCIKARKAGVQIWCYPDIEVGHVSKTIIGLDEHIEAHQTLTVEEIAEDYPVGTVDIRVPPDQE